MCFCTGGARGGAILDFVVSKRGFCICHSLPRPTDAGIDVANTLNVLTMHPSFRSVPDFNWRPQPSARFDD
jgi:hypothetical protein